jgi:transcriptional regulator with XRE-family HTH domain
MFNPNPLYSLTLNELTSKIAGTLKRYRLEKNMSQRELAEITGMDRTSISFIENGRQTSLVSILQILRALNKLEDLNTLLTHETPISPKMYAKLKGKERKKASPKISQL